MEKSAVELSKERSLETAKASAVRVLHVDDDAGFLKTAKPTLEMQGAFQVDTASSVEEAMEKMKNEEYDVVVSDYQMPGKDGLQFLKELRQKGNTIPFVMFTGKGREEIAINALNLGADGYFNKMGHPETVYGEMAHGIKVAFERKNAIETLSTERDRLETVTRNICAGLVIISKDYHTLWANDVFKRIFGDVEGKLCYSTYNQRNDICPKCGVQEIFETGKAKAVHEQVGKDVNGKTVWSEITATPVKDRNGNITAALELVVPITQRKRAEEELRDSAARASAQGEELQTILDSLPLQIWYKDKDNRLVRVNKRFAEYMGVSKKDLEGKPLDDLFPRDIARKCWEEDKEVIETGQPKIDILDRHESAQGLRWFLTSKVPCKDTDGKIIGTINFSLDITERKKAEEALRSSEERWRSLAEGSPDHIMLHDLEFDILYVNRTVPDLKREEVIGTSVFNYVPPEWHRVVKDCFNRVIETGKTDHYDTEYRTKDGEVKYFDVRVGPVLHEDKVVALISTSTDVTSQRRIEMALRESEERFRGIFESATDVMVLLDMTGRILDVNKKAVEVYGGSKGELIGKHFTRICVGIVSPTVIPKVAKAFAEGLTNKKPSINVTIKSKKGQETPLECSNSLLRLNNEPTGLLVVGRDAAERKRAEEELVRSETKYRSLVEQSLQGIVVAQGPAPHLVFANAAISRILGYTPEELTSLSPQETTGLIHPEDRDVFFGRFKDRLEGKPALSHYEVRGIRKDGTVVWLDLSSTGIEFNGHPSVQATFLDITERKKALERLRVLNEKLGVVGKLTRHDVRNKLSAVVGNTYLAKKTLPNDHKAVAYLREIESASIATTRVLDFAAAYESIGVEELALMDVNEAVEEAVSLVSELKGVKVVNNCKGLTVMADSALRQLFFNLIENSLKHGKNVGQIKIYYEEGKDRLKLFYEDNGVGIPKVDKPKLFSEGFTTGSGSGYGLALIKSIVEIYGWAIEEEGEPGKGAKFVMTIPMRADSNQKQRKSNKKTFY